MSAPLVMRLVSAGVAIANRAGRIVRDVMNSGNLGIVDKGINDLQTEADRSAQKSITASFLHQFPNIKIIGEEDLDQAESVEDDWIEKGKAEDVFKMACPSDLQDVALDDVVVWVDPLDGTAEYTQAMFIRRHVESGPSIVRYLIKTLFQNYYLSLLDHVTVLIGISVKGRSVAGVIHQPFYNYQNESDTLRLGRTMWGIVGSGFSGIDVRKPPSDARILTTTRSHLTPEVSAALDAMKADNILRVGGAGHKVLLLIEGKAHAYVFASPGCKKWDTCAPEALLSAMGGYLTDMHGNIYEYHKDVKVRNSGGVLATACKDDHSWYLERVPEAVKSTLAP